MIYAIPYYYYYGQKNRSKLIREKKDGTRWYLYLNFISFVWLVRLVISWIAAKVRLSFSVLNINVEYIFNLINQQWFGTTTGLGGGRR